MPSLLWTSLGDIYQMIDLLCIFSVVFLERRRPQSTLTWILVIMLLPGISGALLYLVFGRGGALFWGYSHKIDQRVRSFEDYQGLVHRQLKLSEQGRIEGYDRAPIPMQDLITLNLQQGSSIYTQNNNLELLCEGKGAFERMFRDIEEAQHTIHAEFFIISNDELGREFIALLARKAAQGVAVRVLYDPWGSMHTHSRFFDPIRRQGGEVTRYFGGAFANLLRANNCNHRKALIIDGHIGYLGGMNIGENYLGHNARLTPWRDTMVRMTGAAVYAQQIYFLMDWEVSTRQDMLLSDEDQLEECFAPLVEQGTVGAQVVLSGLDVGGNYIKQGYLRMIQRAYRSIDLQTPYLSPDDVMMESLVVAVRSGIRVRIMLPDRADKWYVHRVTMSYAGEFAKQGAEVYLYDGFLHAKTLCADDEVVSLGSCNFDERSFSLNLENNLFVFDRGFAAQHREAFERDLSRCRRLTYEQYRKRGLWSHLLESVFRLFGPLF